MRARWLPARALALGCLTSLAAACAGLAPPDKPGAPCTPAFPYRDGWLGGDAAFSVALSASETLWLFGDTFVGRPGQTDRRGAHFVHNSVALSRCRPRSGWEIRYAWGRSPDGPPRAFVERPGDTGWWWLFGGFLHAGRLYLGLLEVEPAPPQGPLRLPFALTGAKLGRVANPDDDVSRWRVEPISLATDPRALPTGAMVPSGDHVYLFQSLDRGDGHGPRGLSRLPLAVLDGRTRDVSGAVETLAADGRWRAGLDPGRARVLMDDDATEMSVSRHPRLGGWVAVYSHPRVDPDFPRSPASDVVWTRTAERLEGPWSRPRRLFRVPELDRSGPRAPDPNLGCYAAKEHPRFSSPPRLSVTYVCNLFAGPDQEPKEVLQRLLLRMDLYRPVPVTPVAPPPIRD